MCGWRPVRDRPRPTLRLMRAGPGAVALRIRTEAGLERQAGEPAVEGAVAVGGRAEPLDGLGL